MIASPDHSETLVYWDLLRAQHPTYTRDQKKSVSFYRGQYSGTIVIDSLLAGKTLTITRVSDWYDFENVQTPWEHGYWQPFIFIGDPGYTIVSHRSVYIGLFLAMVLIQDQLLTLANDGKPQVVPPYLNLYRSERINKFPDITVVVPDFEWANGADNPQLNEIMAGGIVALTTHRALRIFRYENDRIVGIKPITEEVLDDLFRDDGGHAYSYKYSAYIHNERAIQDYKENKFSGPVWYEPEGRKFWTKLDENGQPNPMFLEAMDRMQKSTVTQDEVVENFDRILGCMQENYGNVIVCSNTANADIPIWNRMREAHKKYEQWQKANIGATGDANKDVPNTKTIETRSFSFGRANLQNEYQLNRSSPTIALKKAGYFIPDFSALKDKVHDPYYDAAYLAIQVCCMLIQSPLEMGIERIPFIIKGIDTQA